MANTPLDAPVTGTRTALYERLPALRVLGTFDDALYFVERLVVTGALLLMTAVVCLNIFSQFLSSQVAVFNSAGESTLALLGLWPAPALFVALFFMGRAAARTSPVSRDIPAMHVVGGIAVAGGAIVLATLMLQVSSRTVMLLLGALTTVVLVIAALNTPIPHTRPNADPRNFGRVAVALAVGGVCMYYGLRVPDGFTWAQKLALFLLLWVAFIGASMATHDNRHLMIDAARKAVPQRILPWYNAVSSLGAAVFTAAFCYLAVLYWQNRLAETTTVGEIPDWLKVLSIPFSLALITLRFSARSIAEFLSGLLGVKEAEAPALDLAPAPLGASDPTEA